MSTTHYRTCNICEAMCGVKIEHDGTHILSIKGDENDPLSRGHICPKAVALQDLHNDPDRLRFPLKKTANGFVEIGWDEAFDEVASRLRRIQDDHGRNAVASYVGNPNVHNPGALLFLVPFLLSLRTHNKYSATSVDQLPHMLASMQMLGNQTLLPIPDIDRTDLFICLGANPMASNGSVMSCPDFRNRIKAVKKRGRFVVIDPRKTETAELADEHHFIKPGTDPLLLLAMVNVIAEKNLVKLGNIAAFTDGLDELVALAKPFTPALAAKHTGIPADAIVALAERFAKTERAVLYARIGACAQEFGTLTLWLVYALNMITGHFDRAGGYMLCSPAIDLGAMAAAGGLTGSFGKGYSRVRELPEFNGEYPVATLADEILTPGDGQVRAVVTVMGNPVLSAPDGNRLDEAFASLDFMVCIDMYLNETTRHADIILPTTSCLEHSHFDPALISVAVRNTVKWSPPLFEPESGTKHDWEVLLELTTRLNSRDAVSTLAARANYEVMRRLGPDGLFDLGLRTGPYGARPPALDRINNLMEDAPVLGDVTRRAKKLFAGVRERSIRLDQFVQAVTPNVAARPDGGLSLAYLKAHPHGVDLGALRPAMPDKLCTPDKQIHLAPDLYVDAMALLEERYLGRHHVEEKLPAGMLNLSLIGRRHVRDNNSWLHNSHRLVKGKSRCTAMIHPDDAKTLKVTDGELLEVSSEAGSIRLAAEVTDHIMPGVISIPHGYGHGRSGVSMQIAEANAGVSVNDIVSARWVDPVTGMAVLNGGKVQVKAAGKAAGTTRKRRKTDKMADDVGAS